MILITYQERVNDFRLKMKVGTAPSMLKYSKIKLWKIYSLSNSTIYGGRKMKKMGNK